MTRHEILITINSEQKKRIIQALKYDLNEHNSQLDHRVHELRKAPDNEIENLHNHIKEIGKEIAETENLIELLNRS